MGKVETPEETINRLIAENAALIATNATYKTRIDQIENDNKELTNQVKSGSTEIGRLNEQLTALQTESDEVIAELSTELEKAKAIADVAEPTFTVGSNDYGVIGQKFTYKQKQYTVQELLRDKELQKQLVKIDAGFIYKKAK